MQRRCARARGARASQEGVRHHGEASNGPQPRARSFSSFLKRVKRRSLRLLERDDVAGASSISRRELLTYSSPPRFHGHAELPAPPSREIRLRERGRTPRQRAGQDRTRPARSRGGLDPRRCEVRRRIQRARARLACRHASRWSHATGGADAAAHPCRCTLHALSAVRAYGRPPACCAASYGVAAARRRDRARRGDRASTGASAPRRSTSASRLAAPSPRRRSSVVVLVVHVALVGERLAVVMASARRARRLYLRSRRRSKAAGPLARSPSRCRAGSSMPPAQPSPASPPRRF